MGSHCRPAATHAWVQTQPCPVLISALSMREPGRGCLTQCHLWVWMPAHNDGDRAGLAVAQDRIDFIECHTGHRRVIDFHNLVATPARARMRRLVTMMLGQSLT